MAATLFYLLTAAAAACLLQTSLAFQVGGHFKPLSLSRLALSRLARSAAVTTATALSASNDDDEPSASPVQEYKNAPTKILSNFMGKSSSEDGDDGTPTVTVNPIDAIDFDAPKFNQKVDLDTLAAILDAELYEREWFVTGNVNPTYFSEEFEFQDPDVKLSGIEDYARGVYRLFDQDCSRAEIISTVRNDTMPNAITCTWRLSGKVNIGPGLNIKPYICYTDFTVDASTGLIVMQEDRFAIPQWDVLLSALFPFLIGRVTSEAAPEVEPRVVTMPSIAGVGAGGAGTEDPNPLGKMFQMFGNK